MFAWRLQTTSVPEDNKEPPEPSGSSIFDVWKEEARVIQANDGELLMTFSACGYRCDLCPVFKDNITGSGDQRAVAAGWKKYFDIDMKPEQIICDGCFSDLVEGRELPARECRTRDCVTEKGLETCADCAEYPCEHRETTMNAVEKARDEHKCFISPEEREKYFEPYEARKNFEEIRKGRG